MTCATLCAASMRHLCGGGLVAHVGQQSRELQVGSWSLVDGLIQFCAQGAPETILEDCLPAICEGLKAPAASASASVVVACCMCLRTAAEHLGKRILPCV